MANEGIVGSANTLRRAAVGRKRLRIQGWWASLTVFAIGLALAVEGIWAAVVPVLLIAVVMLWFVGAWVVPWTRDAYVRRVWRVWRAWAADTQLAYGRFSNRQAKFAERLAELSPPPELVAEHERLVALARDQDRLRGQPRTSSWAIDVTAAGEAAWRAAAKLSRDAVSARHQTYAAEVDRLFTRRRDDYTTAAAASERAAADAVRTLTRIKAPDAVASEHQALSAAVSAHLDIARAFHEALQAGDPDPNPDPDGVADAATRWEASVATARDAFRRLADRLDFYQRWPAPPAASSAPDQARS